MLDLPKPSDDLRVGGRLRGFVQNVCVDQEGHNVSVLSGSIGMKKPCAAAAVIESVSRVPFDRRLFR